MIGLYEIPIVNWLFLLLLLLTTSAIALTANAWRLAQQTFYVFDRRDAEIKMQNRMTLAVILVLVMFLFGGYLSIERSAQATEPDATATPEAALMLDSITPHVTRPAATSMPPTPTPSRQATVAAPPTQAAAPAVDWGLPPQYGTLQSKTPLRGDSDITRLVFSTRLTEQLRPAAPATTFDTDVERLYATFEYHNLADGMEWSWIWRKDGVPVDGGNEYWRYGSHGPAFFYLTPADGFEQGVYTAEIWINDTLFGRASATFGESKEIAVRLPDPTPTQPAAEQYLIVTEPEIMLPPFMSIGKLPPQYAVVEPEAPLSSQTEVELIDFDVRHGGEGKAIALLATFRHHAMRSGMAWSWVWRYQDEVLGGGNQLWQYDGDDPMLYMQLVPDEELVDGAYSLEIWINGTLLSRAVFNVTTLPEADE